jgi:hypothetical protein
MTTSYHGVKTNWPRSQWPGQQALPQGTYAVGHAETGVTTQVVTKSAARIPKIRMVRMSSSW